MDFPESISKKDIDKLLVYLQTMNFLRTEKSVESFKEHLNSLSEEDFTRFVIRLAHIKK